MLLFTSRRRGRSLEERSKVSCERAGSCLKLSCDLRRRSSTDRRRQKAQPFRNGSSLSKLRLLILHKAIKIRHRFLRQAIRRFALESQIESRTPQRSYAPGGVSKATGHVDLKGQVDDARRVELFANSPRRAVLKCSPSDLHQRATNIFGDHLDVDCYPQVLFAIRWTQLRRKSFGFRNQEFPQSPLT